MSSNQEFILKPHGLAVGDAVQAKDHRGHVSDGKVLEVTQHGVRVQFRPHFSHVFNWYPSRMQYFIKNGPFSMALVS